MGYSTSIATLEKMLPHLDELEEGKPCAWRVEGMTPFKFGYKVREALYIAQLHEDKFPKLAKAAREFTIQVRGDRVLAVPNEQPNITTIEVEVKADGKPAEDQANLTLVIQGPQTAMTIIEKCIDTKRDSISFPDAELSREDLLRLHRWVEARDKLMFVAFPGITVQKAQENLRDLAWTPED